MQHSLQHSIELRAELSDRLAQLRMETSLTAHEIAEAHRHEARINELEGQIEQASPQLGSLKQAVSTLQRRILDVGGPRLSRAQAKVDILSKVGVVCLTVCLLVSLSVCLFVCLKSCASLFVLLLLLLLL